MSAAASSRPQWWLLQEGSASGPFDQGAVAAQLERGQLSWDALAAPVGSTEWRPLRAWHAFPPPREPDRPATQNAFGDGPSAFAWRPAKRTRVPALPGMAEWICVYGLFVSPVLWIFFQLSGLWGTTIFLKESPLYPLEFLLGLIAFAVSLVSLGLLLIGAWLLRGRRRLGVTLLIGGLGLDLGWFIVALAALAMLFAAAASDPTAMHVNPSEEGIGVALIVFVMSLSAGIFEIVALVWLLAKGRQLPLKS